MKTRIDLDSVSLSPIIRGCLAAHPKNAEDILHNLVLMAESPWKGVRKIGRTPFNTKAIMDRLEVLQAKYPFLTLFVCDFPSKNGQMKTQILWYDATVNAVGTETEFLNMPLPQEKVDKIRNALEQLVEEGDHETLILLGTRYVAADVRCGTEDDFEYGDPEEDAVTALSRDELEAEIMSGVEDYLTDKYQVETMAKLYL